MNFYFITLFPDELRSFFQKGIIGKAVDAGIIRPHFINLRDFAINRYGQVDDPPFGGKKGMLIRVDVLYNAITSVPDYKSAAIFSTCPKGDILSQSTVSSIQNNYSSLIILSGYYEGFDDRIYTLLPIQRFSIGNVILSSGDPAAIALAESVARLVPGVIGDPDCISEDSHVSGLLEHPQYAPPRVFQNLPVPDILLSGHHKNIASWKRQQSLGTSLLLQPQLLADVHLSQEDKALLTDFLKE
ncbi:tRNA (guanosine(37)-N1)-methyltransferase TrmD [bacterium]|nr:tRNA (guanosine(37)-N1)-methyltransferase TrmD [bacterium]